jgi:2-polyprenyl-3-methyl-5-hydroxy-6-metoxy-1,4-benzoquinol methylase
MTAHGEVSQGQRFAFGRNWERFAAGLDDEQVEGAVRSLKQLLPFELAGRSFLDAGSGSGLSSLAALRLGAREVTSFDFDETSAETTAALRTREGATTPWAVHMGSVLDADFLHGLGHFDVVYSWGVLHHTGDQWTAMDNLLPLVAPGGHLAVALYNDQGLPSRLWKRVKHSHVRGGPLTRGAIEAAGAAYFGARRVAGRVLGERSERPRGMEFWTDVRDWVGGWPFEVAGPDEVVDHVHGQGLRLVRLRTVAGRLGCNEFVFVRAPS